MYILHCLCSENQPDVKHHQLPKMKPLPSMEFLGPPPTKPPRPPAVSLHVFQGQTAVSKTHREGEEMHRAPHVASQPAGRSHGSRACIPQSPPAPHQFPGDNAELLFPETGHPSLLILS